MSDRRLDAIDRQLRACAAMAGAALLPLGSLATPAAADIYVAPAMASTTFVSMPYETVLVIDFPDTPGFASVFTFTGAGGIDGAGTAYPDAELFLSWGPSAKLFLDGSNPYPGKTTDKTVYFLEALTFPYFYHELIPAGKPVSGGSGPFSFDYTTLYSPISVFDMWAKGDAGYVAFVIKDTILMTSYYGWVAVELASSGYEAMLTKVAWQSTPGEVIFTGVPEPSALSLAGLALGALGLARWRRRRA